MTDAEPSSAAELSAKAERWRAGPGVLLEEARQARRLSKRGAAREAGFSESTWRQLEDGERQVTEDVRVPVNPRDDTLVAAARAVGIDPAVLFEAAGRPFRGPREPLGMDASGVDLEELRRLDPEAYGNIQALARIALEQARQRHKG